ncbi:MAG TPA: response regulator [Blastocatellia bacterium]|nr:response regulator [Blastocatellia bacterium]
MWKPCVLLVEDNADLRQLYTFFLAGRGFEVRLAEDGEEALAEIQKQRPDVLLTDIAMPQMDGVELIQRLRSDEEFASLPVVAMTAYGEGRLTEAWAAGADETIAKPMEANDLLTALFKVMPKQQGN